MSSEANKEKILEQKLADILKANKMTIATAESCTGGLAASRITDISGSSEYYLGGVISYSNASKIAFLGVQKETLETFGAVSEQTARAMAKGIRQKLQSDLAVAITGIAGPDGGTKEKPTGLTYIAFSSNERTFCRKYLWKGTRIQNKNYSVDAALHMVIEFLDKP